MEQEGAVEISLVAWAVFDADVPHDEAVAAVKDAGGEVLGRWEGEAAESQLDLDPGQFALKVGDTSVATD